MDVFANELPRWSEHHSFDIGGLVGSVLGGGKGGGSSSSTTTSNKNSYNTGINGNALSKVVKQFVAAEKPAAQQSQLLIIGAVVIGAIFLMRR